MRTTPILRRARGHRQCRSMVVVANQAELNEALREQLLPFKSARESLLIRKEMIATYFTILNRMATTKVASTLARASRRAATSIRQCAARGGELAARAKAMPMPMPIRRTAARQVVQGFREPRNEAGWEIAER